MRLSKAVSPSDVDKLFPGWYYPDMTEICQTNIALMMAHGARSEIKYSAKRRVSVAKYSGLPDSAADIPGFLKLPRELSTKITATVRDNFSQSYWKKYATGTRTFMDRTIRRAIKEGWTPDETAKYIARDPNNEFGLKAARRIVRTETTSALNGGQFLVREKDITDGLIDGSEWIATLDNDVRDDHRGAHHQQSVLDGGQWVIKKNGKQIAKGRGFVLGVERARFPGDPNLSAGNRINCLHPSQPVEGSFVAGTKAFYRGQMVKIVTASGRRLCVTEGHPVATATGWVSAGDLKESDRVMCSTSHVGRGFRRISEDPQDTPLSVQNVFEAISLFGVSESCGRGTVDFNGDEQFFQSDVDVVLINCMLLRDAESGIAYGRRNRGLVFADEAAVHRDRLSTALLDRELLPLLAFRSGMRSQLNTMLFEKPIDCGSALTVRVTDAVRAFASGITLDDIVDRQSVWRQSDRYASVHEYLTDASAAASFCPSDLCHRVPELIEFDDIVRIDNSWYEGHVYDLQSVNVPAIVADGIITRNCRCTTVPVVDLSDDVPVSSDRVTDVTPSDDIGSPVQVTRPRRPAPVEPETTAVEVAPVKPDRSNMAVVDRIADQIEVEKLRRTLIDKAGDGSHLRSQLDEINNEIKSLNESSSGLLKAKFKERKLDSPDYDLIRRMGDQMDDNMVRIKSLRESQRKLDDEIRDVVKGALSLGDDSARMSINTASSGGPTDGASTSFLRRMFRRDQRPLKTTSKRHRDKLNDAREFVESITAARDELQSITFKAYRLPKNARPFSMESTESLPELRAIYYAENTSTDVVAHEIGHQLEDHIPELRKLAQEFVEHRTKHTPNKKLAEVFKGAGYRADEIGNADEFAKAFGDRSAWYVGKTYKRGSTEIVSMAIELLYRDPVHFAQADPEFFNFIVAALRGTL